MAWKVENPPSTASQARAHHARCRVATRPWPCRRGCAFPGETDDRKFRRGASRSPPTVGAWPGSRARRFPCEHPVRPIRSALGVMRSRAARREPPHAPRHAFDFGVELHHLSNLRLPVARKPGARDVSRDVGVESLEGARSTDATKRCAHDFAPDGPTVRAWAPRRRGDLGLGHSGWFEPDHGCPTDDRLRSRGLRTDETFTRLSVLPTPVPLRRQCVGLRQMSGFRTAIPHRSHGT